MRSAPLRRPTSRRACPLRIHMYTYEFVWARATYYMTVVYYREWDVTKAQSFGPATAEFDAECELAMQMDPYAQAAAGLARFEALMACVADAEASIVDS